MSDVRRHRHHLRVAATHELGVHHHVVDPDVGEQPPVAVPRLDVGLESHVAGADEPAIALGRFAPARLFALPRMMHFRGIDADISDLLDPIADADVDRVAVDDPHDDALDRTGGGDGGGEENEEDGDEHARARTQHTLTVSRSPTHRQGMDTVGWHPRCYVSASPTAADAGRYRTAPGAGRGAVDGH